MNHLRHSGLPFERQRDILFDVVRTEPLLTDALEAARALDLPQWRIAVGAIYIQARAHLWFSDLPNRALEIEGSNVENATRAK